MCKNPFRRFASSSFILIGLCSCAVGPDYQKPDVTALTPSAWHWKVVEPQDTISKGDWWNIFHDPSLNDLETAAVANNQNLRAAVARVDQARATARVSRSRFFPELSLDPSYKHERTSGDLPTPIPFDIPSAHLDTFSVPLDLSYEVDLWGRVRRSFESSKAQAHATVADYQNVLLTLTADVAVNYFLARSLDLEIATLRRTIELRNESLRILNERFRTGVIPEIDAAQAKTELASAKAELADARRQRAETVNALALLCGKPASAFRTRQKQPCSRFTRCGSPRSPFQPCSNEDPILRVWKESWPRKNAQIGVAKVGYFPALRLTGTGWLSKRRSRKSLCLGQSRLVHRTRCKFTAI